MPDGPGPVPTTNKWPDALAELGERVSCKLSGLAMPFGSVSEEALKPWIEYALDAFGVNRCFFASNFPVDAPYGTFDELYGTFSALTAHLGDEERDQLFAGNAERIYRL
jgi:L-fuconolactonase